MPNSTPSNANLVGANLYGTDLSGANLNEVELNETILGNVNLSGAIGLDTIIHRGPSSVDMRTLRQSWPLPLSFLRGVGLDDHFIDYLPGLVGQAIDFYSCFISHSTRDADFATRLYNDLQGKGIRCWYAPEDMQGGKKTHEQIFDAIRVHEKLLIILSENSMSSTWVETEIRRARKRERNEGRRMLFPVSLCSYEELQSWELFDADEGRDLAGEIREYYIPNFAAWKSHDDYEREFAKLLRDLSVE